MTKTFRRTMSAVLLATVAAAGLTACSSDADTASKNLSQAADNFEVPRRVVFYNGITDKIMLEVVGYCSLGNADSAGQLSVTCKTGPDQYKKEFLGLSDNVTYYAEQLDPVNVPTNHYVVNFKPTEIIPAVDLRVK